VREAGGSRQAERLFLNSAGGAAKGSFPTWLEDNNPHCGVVCGTTRAARKSNAMGVETMANCVLRTSR